MLPLERAVRRRDPRAVGLAGGGARRSLAAVEPSIARDGRVVYLVDGGGRRPSSRPRWAASGAGFRLAGGAARATATTRRSGSSSWFRPARSLPPGPRTRANVALEPLPGGAGDPDLVPGTGPVRRARAVRSAAVLGGRRQRGRSSTIAVESAEGARRAGSHERLLGEILVGLDRAGQLRRLVATAACDDAAAATDDRERERARPRPDGGGGAPDDPARTSPQDRRPATRSEPTRRGPCRARQPALGAPAAGRGPAGPGRRA